MLMRSPASKLASRSVLASDARPPVFAKPHAGLHGHAVRLALPAAAEPGAAPAAEISRGAADALDADAILNCMEL